MKIAIIGSGISGLVCAHHLQHKHEITLFEANHYIGGHTNTVDIEIDGQSIPVDTGFIVYNDRTYPNFIRLLNELEIEGRPTSMSFSVKDPVENFEYSGSSLNTLFAQRKNIFRPSFYQLIRDILRFNRDATKDADELRSDMTAAEYVRLNRYSQEFATKYLYPMGSAIWSCPIESFAQFPIRFIAQFYRNHGLLQVRNRPQWRTLPGGSRTYVKAITRSFENRIRLNTPVVKVVRFADEVLVSTKNGSVESFDHVIFCCHSVQALRILGNDATQLERIVLAAFPYSRNVATLHTDTSLLPNRKRAWSSWNYLLRHQANTPACVTYNMNILQHLECEPTVCVTLNGEDAIEPGKILRNFIYHHPIFSTDRENAQAHHHELINRNHTSYCGAYWGNGFHEDGVVSALRVVERLQNIEQYEATPKTGQTLQLATVNVHHSRAGRD